MTRLEAIAILDGFKYNPLLNDQHYEALDMAVSALSENKGDLISRQAVLDELEKWDWQDLYLPIHFKQILDDVPSVENKGEWIPKERLTDCSLYVDIVCSECGNVGIEAYAYGYELDELPVQEMKDYIKKHDMNYCPCCGAKMEGGE
jgi:hypothetical protein